MTLALVIALIVMTLFCGVLALLLRLQMRALKHGPPRSFLPPETRTVMSKCGRRAGPAADRISTAHLLWAILDEPDESVRIVLGAHRVSADALRDQLSLPPAERHTRARGTIHFSDAAQKVWASAYLRSESLQWAPIRPGDLLRELTSAEDETGALLRACGFSGESVQRALDSQGGG